MSLRISTPSLSLPMSSQRTIWSRSRRIEGATEWPFVTGGKEKRIAIRPRLVVNDVELALRARRDGHRFCPVVHSRTPRREEAARSGAPAMDTTCHQCLRRLSAGGRAAAQDARLSGPPAKRTRALMRSPVGAPPSAGLTRMRTRLLPSTAARNSAGATPADPGFCLCFGCVTVLTYCCTLRSVTRRKRRQKPGFASGHSEISSSSARRVGGCRQRRRRLGLAP